MKLDCHYVNSLKGFISQHLNNLASSVNADARSDTTLARHGVWHRPCRTAYLIHVYIGLFEIQNSMITIIIVFGYFSYIKRLNRL